MRTVKGSLATRGTFAYVAQQVHMCPCMCPALVLRTIIAALFARCTARLQAWIQNASVRENILFGDEFRQEQYDEVGTAARSS